MSLNSTTRFSDKVDNYIKYRPHYPEMVINFLKGKGILKDDSIIADIGSGTGISTELFLANGNKVYGVEPNKEMREAAEKLFADNSNFISVNGTAEFTTLNNNSIDLIIAGQAFHWFDIEKTKKEFKRILKPGGNVVLMWNIRKLDGSALQNDYEKLLLKYGTDYKDVGHTNFTKIDFKSFFDGDYETAKFDYEQLFDFNSFKGRLLSSSYIPNEDRPEYNNMIDELRKIFEKYKENGKLSFKYDTEIFTGKI